MEIVRPISHTGITAENVRKLRRHAAAPQSAARQLASVRGSGLVDINDAGSTYLPGLLVGEIAELTVPFIGVTVNTTGPLTVNFAQADDGSGIYAAFPTLNVIDPITGDSAYLAAGTLSPVPSSGTTEPTWAAPTITGTTFDWDGTHVVRTAPGPVVGFVQYDIFRLS